MAQKELSKVRIDKWLWSVRIFKSRTIAADACKKSKVKVNDATVKPSFLLERGAIVEVKKEGFNLKYKVIDLIDKRVSATLAQPCYENLTSEEEMNKFKDWFNYDSPAGQREKGAGRPTKKERRKLDTFKKG